MAAATQLCVSHYMSSMPGPSRREDTALQKRPHGGTGASDKWASLKWTVSPSCLRRLGQDMTALLTPRPLARETLCSWHFSQLTCWLTPGPLATNSPP